MNINDTINDIKITLALITPLLALQLLPATCNYLYEKTTTKFTTEYNIRVEDVDTTRIGGFGTPYYEYKIIGDTNAQLYDWRALNLLPNKDYVLTLKAYGFFGEQTKIENIKEK